MLKKITLLLVAFLFLAAGMYAANKRFTLVIDAGHGGHDAGALGAKSKEKNINLNVALAFGRYVERNMPDVRVIYTRTTDVFIPLHDRANIANKANADLFISVHTNALPAGKIARGFETYSLGMHRAKDNLDVAMRENSVISMEKGYQQTYQGFDPKSSESYIIFEFIQGKNMERSVEIARSIQNSVCQNANRPDKGVHQAGFLVLRETSMPSCLIELGFITTPDEENLLNDESRIDDIAKAIYEGFAKYKNKYDKRVTIPYRSQASEGNDIPSIVPDSYKRTVAPVKKQTPASVKSDAPIFKVQILVSSRVLRKGDAHFKGEENYDSYQESGMVKYTIGASANYNEIYQLRKSLLDKFPEAFIIAFKNGKKYDVNQAIREFKQNKNR
ncbi:MAG: N-acetylmuramoyl-L-alanine amidase [Prevotella sp.]|nr:N-acetylmuramoyl-L-alanine amidase [Prevotella sp.]